MDSESLWTFFQRNILMCDLTAQNMKYESIFRGGKSHKDPTIFDILRVFERVLEPVVRR